MSIIDGIIDALARGLAVVLLALVSLVPNLTPQQATTAPAPVATTTRAIATSTPETQPAKTASTTPKAAPAKAPAPAQTPAQVQSSTPSKTQEEVNDAARAALVNIYCSTKVGGYLSPISASGVIIDSRGVILTNAHVGQYFLLRDYVTQGNVDCVVRTGSPATPRYTARLIYLPPAWIEANASQIVATQAHGTGQDDYAFLYITGTPSGEPLPGSFATLPMDLAFPDVGDEMLLAAYPAGYLGGETITKALYATSALAYTTQLFNFAQGASVDLFSIGGSVVSQAGSSGGAVVRLKDGTLAGIIATATVADSTERRDLRAITLAHIDTTLKSFGQGGIAALLTGDLAAKAATFEKTIAPAERATLYGVLNGQ